VNWNSTDKKEIRKFGSITLLIFGSLCALGHWKSNFVPIYLFGFLTILGFGFILLPGPMRPIYTAWLSIAHVLGTILTKAILTLAYFLVITPAAVIKRLFGGPPLPLKPDKQVSSYWVTRNEPTQPKERFLKRY
jgi:hypothetical protein